MMNMFTLVGRIKELEQKSDHTIATISVHRKYKNLKGEYETDDIKIILLGRIASNTLEYCRIGDVIGAKGRIETKGKSIRLIAERISFLSSKKVDE